MHISDTTKYILKAFIPFTEANAKLSFYPKSFFQELDKLHKINERTLHSAYYRAIKNGLIFVDDDNIPRLTAKGLRNIKLYKPKLLSKGAKLIVIFDIPEEERVKRQRLRLILRELKFVKIQQSVWECRFDCREYLQAEIAESDLGKYVVVYEALRLT
ncbi:MAG: CRISPR-associated endonuclease Cas2 [bacterium]|nr:CRISPR-associated endonuclease Cas2 [bacterium]